MPLTFRDDVRGPAFAELLEAMLPVAATVGLVDSGDYRGDGAVRFLAAMEPKRISTGESRAWPGSLVPDWAPALLVHTFRYDQEVAGTLYSHCPALLGWQNRGLPYDLHLTNGEGGPVLGSITSEDDAWVDLRMAEWRRLVGKTRWLRRIRVRDDRG